MSRRSALTSPDLNFFSFQLRTAVSALRHCFPLSGLVVIVRMTEGRILTHIAHYQILPLRCPFSRRGGSVEGGGNWVKNGTGRKHRTREVDNRMKGGGMGWEIRESNEICCHPKRSISSVPSSVGHVGSEGHHHDARGGKENWKKKREREGIGETCSSPRALSTVSTYFWVFVGVRLPLLVPRRFNDWKRVFRLLSLFGETAWG